MLAERTEANSSRERTKAKTSEKGFYTAFSSTGQPVVKLNCTIASGMDQITKG